MRTTYLFSVAVLSLFFVTAKGISQVEANSNSMRLNKSNADYSNNGYNNYNNNNNANTGQRTSTYFPNDTTMIVTMMGLLNAKADSYVAQFAITQNGPTIDTATMFINNRIKKFTEQLKKLGIKPGDIIIDQISQVPVYEYSVEKKLFSDTYNEIPTSFEVKKNVLIGYNDPQILDDIMNAAAHSEIYDIAKVDYNLNDISDKYNRLRKDCLKQIKEKVEDFSTMGLKFTPLQQTFSESSQTYYPNQRYSQYAAFNNASVQNVNAGLKKNNTVVSAAKPVTSYYDKVPYNQFDVVINPHMIEPSVQFTYTVSIKYILKGQDHPVGLTAPIGKVETPGSKTKEKISKMKLPSTVEFKFDVPNPEAQ